MIARDIASDRWPRGRETRPPYEKRISTILAKSPLWFCILPVTITPRSNAAMRSGQSLPKHS
ncbi:hypothetical protein MASSI9I_51251 [Massilia sp. 9I]|nr:hypothetical protein MASSI9I_51251 [Massilia sp. 9I]